MAYNIELDGLQVKNAEGKSVVGSDFKVQIKELDTYKRTFWAVASDEGEDRDKDIIRVAGWNLKNYLNSPRGLWMHDYREHPHFKTLSIKREKNDKQLIFQPQFDTHERALLTFNQFANGFLDDFSVGFIPGEYNYRDESNTWAGGRDFIKNHELLEISAVTVPANPNARIFRSAGLLPEDQNNLAILGYKSHFLFKDDINSYWYPILLDMNAYKNPKNIKLGNGITVVKALPRFSEDVNELVIGYFFDREQYNTEKSITDWVNSQLLVKPTRKYFQIDFGKNEDTLDITVVSEEFVIPIQIEEDKTIIEIENEKDLTTDDVPENLLGRGTDDKPEDEDDEEENDDKVCNCDVFEASENDDNKCKGCGGKKPPAKSEENEIEKLLPWDEIIERDVYLAEAEKPFPNEHACRLKDPGGFDKFARKNCAQKHDEKCIDVIYGIKEGTSEIQSLRYKKSIWEASAAKSHCSSRNGKFEAASSGESSAENTPNNEKPFTEDQEKFIVQLFDKALEDKVKDIVTQVNVVKAEMENIKGLFAEFNETIKGLEKFSDDKLLDLSELNLPMVSSPVPKGEEDSEEIQIDPEKFQQKSKEVILGGLSELFKRVFKEEKDKLSGKLD